MLDHFRVIEYDSMINSLVMEGVITAASAGILKGAGKLGTKLKTSRALSSTKSIEESASSFRRLSKVVKQSYRSIPKAKLAKLRNRVQNLGGNLDEMVMSLTLRLPDTVRIPLFKIMHLMNYFDIYQLKSSFKNFLLENCSQNLRSRVPHSGL